MVSHLSHVQCLALFCMLSLHLFNFVLDACHVRSKLTDDQIQEVVLGLECVNQGSLRQLWLVNVQSNEAIKHLNSEESMIVLFQVIDQLHKVCENQLNFCISQ